jgi:hypothetical protein
MNKKKDEMGGWVDGWMGHVACVRKMKSAYKFWLESLKVQDHLEDLGQGWQTFLRAHAQILSHAHGNSEQQNEVLESFIIIINYYDIIIATVKLLEGENKFYCKIITGREPKNKIVGSILGSLFTQPITSHRFWFV